MTCMRASRIVATVIAASMFFGSTRAMAAAAPSSSPNQVSSWATLSALSAGAPAATLCGAKTATAATGQARSRGCVLPVADKSASAAEATPAALPLGAASGFQASDLIFALGALAAVAFAGFAFVGHHHSISPA
jgi:hypothetical protein